MINTKDRDKYFGNSSSLGTMGYYSNYSGNQNCYPILRFGTSDLGSGNRVRVMGSGYFAQAFRYL
jgi:hypothetical protein